MPTSEIEGVLLLNFNIKMLIVVVILPRPVLLNTVGKLNNALGFEIRDYRERPASTDYRVRVVL
jgi:hypothetical protein